jgi:hypothetical protein
MKKSIKRISYYDEENETIDIYIEEAKSEINFLSIELSHRQTL